MITSQQDARHTGTGRPAAVQHMQHMQHTRTASQPSSLETVSVLHQTQLQPVAHLTSMSLTVTHTMAATTMGNRQ